MKAHGGTAGWPARSQAPRVADQEGPPEEEVAARERQAPSTQVVQTVAGVCPTARAAGSRGNIFREKKNKYQTTKTLLLPRAQAIERSKAPNLGKMKAR